MITPVEQLKKYLGFHFTDDSKWYIKRFLRDLINCEYCFSFWLGLIIYKDFWIACIVSLSTYTLKKIIESCQ